MVSLVQQIDIKSNDTLRSRTVTYYPGAQRRRANGIYIVRTTAVLNEEPKDMVLVHANVRIQTKTVTVQARGAQKREAGPWPGYK